MNTSDKTIKDHLATLTPEKKREALKAAHKAVAGVLNLDQHNIKLSGLSFAVGDKKTPGSFFEGDINDCIFDEENRCTSFGIK